jgi:predicted membrane chloride channel (bestrophin family)
VQIVLKRLSLLSRKTAGEEGTKSLKGIEPPLEGQFYAMIEKIETLFASMELIDRTQFPFPYSQIMKILLYFWILALPFVLADSCGASTPAVMVLIGIGFFGLDEVGEKPPFRASI